MTSPVQILEPHRFDERIGSWTPVCDAIDGSHRPQLTLVTFNVWFAEYRMEERLAALLELVRRCDPDVIGLQEITPPYLERIVAEPWVREHYWISDASGLSVEPHGVLLLSRAPIHNLALCALPSRKDRKLLVAELQMNGQPLYVGNLHLESSAINVPLRLAQLGTVLPSLQGAKHAILMGDFNFDPAQEAEQSRVDARYRDLWRELRGDEPGYTEDTDINRMRLLHKGTEKRVRYDRILLRSLPPGWRPRSIRLIGTDPISPELPEVFPSDHFGLVGTLEWGGRTGG